MQNRFPSPFGFAGHYTGPAGLRYLTGLGSVPRRRPLRVSHSSCRNRPGRHWRSLTYCTGSAVRLSARYTPGIMLGEAKVHNPGQPSRGCCARWTVRAPTRISYLLEYRPRDAFFPPQFHFVHKSHFSPRPSLFFPISATTALQKTCLSTQGGLP